MAKSKGILPFSRVSHFDHEALNKALADNSYTPATIHSKIVISGRSMSKSGVENHTSGRSKPIRGAILAYAKVLNIHPGTLSDDLKDVRNTSPDKTKPRLDFAPTSLSISTGLNGFFDEIREDVGKLRTKIGKKIFDEVTNDGDASKLAIIQARLNLLVKDAL